jgi:hypothetical protein
VNFFVLQAGLLLVEEGQISIIGIEHSIATVEFPPWR